MDRVKLLTALVFAAFAVTSCFNSKPDRYVISGGKEYAASLFRQNCAVCHGPEADGRVLDNGTKVPSLRAGEFKVISEDAIYNQIANGGNGMVPFRDQLTERELKLMAHFVYHDLRGN